MKKIFLALFCAAFALSVSAQSSTRYLRISHFDGTFTEIPVSSIDSIDFITKSDPGQGGEENQPTYRDSIQWTALPLFGLSSTPLSNEVYTIELANGLTVECQAHLGTYYLLDNGLYVGSDNYLHGVGYLAPLEMPTYVITSPAEYAGYYVSLSGGYEIVEATGEYRNYADTVGYALGGNIVNFQDYATFMDEYYLQQKWTGEEAEFGTFVAKYQSSIEGAFIGKYDAENQQFYIDEAMIKSGVIVDADIDGDGADDFEYILNIEWLDGFYGLALDSTGEDVARPYSFVSTEKQYVAWDLMGALEGSQAPARTKKVTIPNQRMEMKSLKAVSMPKLERVAKSLK